MKVLILTKSFPPKVDGVGDYSYNLGKAFSTTSLISKVYYATEKAELGTDEDCFYFDNWTMTEFFQLNAYIKNKEIDFLVFQYVPYSFNKFGMPFSLPRKIKLLEVKKVITFHEIAIGFHSYNPKIWFIAASQRFLSWQLALLADALVTSTGLYVSMLKRFNSKTFRIGIGSNFNTRFNNSSTQTPHCLTLVSFSNRIKAPLLNAIKSLIQKGVEVQLIGVGKIHMNLQAALQAQVEKLGIQKFVSFKGVLFEQELLSILASADIYLQLENVDKNKNGGVSLKSGALAVAMSCGLPIVTTNGKMTDSSLLRHGKEVFYVSLTEPSIVKAIQVVNLDRELNDSLRKHSLEYYSSNLTWDAIANKYIQVLHQLKTY